MPSSGFKPAMRTLPDSPERARHPGAALSVRWRRLVASGLFAWAFAAQAGPGVHADRIVLGQSAKLSGASGTLAGVQYRAGLLLAFDQVNREGGVHGRRIELVSLDDRIDPVRARANTRELIERVGVLAMIGSTFSNTVLGALPVLAERGVPLIAPYTGVGDLYTGRHPLVFMLRASFDDELSAIVRHIGTIRYRRVGIVHYAIPMGDALAADFQRHLAGRAMELAQALHMALSSPDPAAAAAPVIAGAAVHCVDLMFLGVSGRDAAEVIRGLRTRCPGTQFIARSLVDPIMLRTELGEHSTGIMLTQVVPNAARGEHPLVKGYRSLLARRQPPSTMDPTEFEGYLAGQFMIAALRQAGPQLDRDALIQALEHTAIDGPDHYRLRFARGERVATRYVNIVMLADGQRWVD